MKDRARGRCGICHRIAGQKARPLRRVLQPHRTSSIDPELMLRMLLLGYVFAIGSERQICSEA